MPEKEYIKLPKNIWVRRFLFLLVMGVSLGLSPTPRHYFRLLKTIPAEWRKINRSHIYRLSRSLKRRGYIEYKKYRQNEIRVTITDKGRQHLRRLEFDDLELSRKNLWDGKWRLILFDIPEPRKRSRDALRKKLKELGCTELQKSVFVWPYECREEIKLIVDFFKIEPHVVYAEALIKNDLNLKKIFKL
jgi:DNA-binding transcriptional regulator PaaX